MYAACYRSRLDVWLRKRTENDIQANRLQLYLTVEVGGKQINIDMVGIIN